MFERPSKEESYLTQEQKELIRAFAGDDVAQKVFRELAPFTPVGLISLESESFKCEFQIPAPRIFLNKKNWSITGQATAKTTEMVLLVKKDGKIETYHVPAQNSMLYVHDSRTESTLHEQSFWNDTKSGEFEIPLNDLPGTRSAKTIMVRNTIFTDLILDNGTKIDCRDTSGIVGQESQNIGQRSPFSNVINNPLAN